MPIWPVVCLGMGLLPYFVLPLERSSFKHYSCGRCQTQDVYALNPHDQDNVIYMTKFWALTIACPAIWTHSLSKVCVTSDDFFGTFGTISLRGMLNPVPPPPSYRATYYKACKIQFQKPRITVSQSLDRICFLPTVIRTAALLAHLSMSGHGYDISTLT